MKEVIPMPKYESWIDQTDGAVRVIEVEANGVRAAYRLAQAQCQPGEYSRGVVEITETAQCDPETVGDRRA